MADAPASMRRIAVARLTEHPIRESGVFSFVIFLFFNAHLDKSVKMWYTYLFSAARGPE